MESVNDHYCQTCGHRGDGRLPLCERCGTRRAITRAGGITGATFILNELGEYPLNTVLTPEQRAGIEAYYGDRLRAFLTPRPAGPPPAPAVAGPAAAVSPVPAARPAAPVSPVPAARPVVPPAPSSIRRQREMDWSWLAEQQANLFLFAGAFLTVVAALIFVGYSGQAVSNAWKMAMLAGYTVAFLGAGALCLRIPRVEMAGRVFFAVGSILVPINFVAARALVRDDDLSAESMWLAGSVISAAFYAAVAWLGLGRAYAFASGIAIVSATMAFVVLADVPPEWAPAFFIAVAIAMSVVGLAGPERFQRRLGTIWTPQAHAVAIASTLFAIGTAGLSGAEEIEVSTKWFLPLSCTGFFAYATIQMVSTKRMAAGIGAIGGAGATWLSLFFATALPAEYYAVALAALGMGLGAAMMAASSAPEDARLPGRFDETLRWSAIAATGASLLIAFLILQASTGEEATYELSSRWFLAPVFALMLPLYGVDAFLGRQATGVGGVFIATAGLAASVVFGLDASPEYYTFALLGPALIFASIARRGRHPVLDRLPDGWRELTFLLGYAAAGGAVIIAAGVVLTAAQPSSEYEPQFRAFLPLVAAGCGAFAAIDASRGTQHGFILAAMSVIGLGAAIVYVFDPSAEIYAFGCIGGALVIAVAARFTRDEQARLLYAAWREDAFVVARLGGAIAAAIAIGAVLMAASEARAGTYEPATRWFLPLFGVLATAAALLDASRVRRPETTVIACTAITGTALAVMYAVEAHPAYYGAVLGGTAIALALAGRAVEPAWVDGQARDIYSAIGVTISWVLFEQAYTDLPRVGAGVNIAAAFFYAAAAMTDTNERTLGQIFDIRDGARVRLAVGWLYAAGLTAVIGYVFMLESMPADEDAAGGSLSAPLMFCGVAFALAGVVAKRLRPEFSSHLYVMALAVALLSLAVAPGTGMLLSLLGIFIVLFLALAVYEDNPVVAAPSAVFGFAAVAAWRAHADAAWWLLPAAYSGIGIALASAGVALRERRAWSQAALGSGAVYAAAAPIVGFATLLGHADEQGLVDGTAMHRTALYRWSTLSLAILGALTIAYAFVLHRRWVIMVGTTVLLGAALLGIVMLEPENPQAYTATIGAYLVGAGLLGLWKFRLIPAVADAAPLVEGAGAALIMLPSFIQSLDAGWRYQWIMLVEALAFFALSVALRRHGMLAAALAAMVLVAGRALFDAVNALPNWVVVAGAGSALLAVGVAILLGRDRWSAWQESIMKWWSEPGDGHSTPDAGPQA